ncbi:hypothetical protein FXO37_35821 [Capsicum annuum]|nr:hypothetical protein FXO37_35821 [Capsicum annuum]
MLWPSSLWALNLDRSSGPSCVDLGLLTGFAEDGIPYPMILARLLGTFGLGFLKPIQKSEVPSTEVIEPIMVVKWAFSPPRQKIGRQFGVRSVHWEDRPPNSKFFPGSFNVVDYDNNRDYKQTRDDGKAVRSALS